MTALYSVLTAAQRGAARVAVDAYRGNDFMGWRQQLDSALTTPGEVIRDSQALNCLWCDLGGLANLAERSDGHRLSNRPQLAIECRSARAAIAAAFGHPFDAANA
jgi:hypothetical protein